MLTLTAASFKGVSSNTPLNLQNTSDDSISSTFTSHLDYHAVLGNIPATDNVGELKSLLYRAISAALPNQNYDELFDQHFALYSDSVAACNHAVNEMTNLSHIVDSNIQFINKPFKVNDVQYLENRLVTKLPIVGGYTINKSLDNPSINYLFRFSGSFFSMLTIKQTREFLTVWSDTITSSSRMDIAIDDPTFTIIPFDEMLQSCLDGNFAGFNNYDPRIDYAYKSETAKPGEYPSHTLYLGSRNSSEFTRIYNHKNKCLRLEKELKGKVAMTCYNNLINATHLTDIEWAKLLMQYAIGSIKFIDRTSPSGGKQSHVDRCPPLAFWADFLSIIDTEPVRLPRPNPNIALSATFNWITRQVSSFLGAAYVAYGKDKFIKYLESEFDRHITKPSLSFLGYISAIQLTDELAIHSYNDKSLNLSPF